MPKINKALLSNNSDIWETPTGMYNYYKSLGYFDPCPINPSFDGLTIEWKDKNFVNPPYSNLDQWVDKSIKEMRKGHDVIMLVPARTDTRWFRKLVEAGGRITFIQGRLKFSNKKSAPFPSMLVILSCLGCLMPKFYHFMTKEERLRVYGV